MGGGGGEGFARRLRQHGEPGDLTASLQCGPVQLFQHAVDVRRVPVSAKHKMGCSSL